MGRNLGLNMENKGFSVAMHDVDKKRIEEIKKEFGERNILPTTDLKEFVGSLKNPRKVMLMVTAGGLVDKVISGLLPLLEKGDLVIDAGNSYFKDTIRRSEEVQGQGLLYIGTGVSGGEEGALKGPAIMPGGDRKTYKLVEPILTKISAQVEGEPCCTHIGENGAGHYVKMIHNGIEYGDMQLIAEAYYLMENALGMSVEEMGEVFSEWNSGDLDSYLIEITAEILKKKDEETGKPMLDVILDRAGQKGTGAWTSANALELGVAAPTIAEAVFARCISAIKEERLAAAKQLKGPSGKYEGDKAEFIKAIHDALYASKVCSYAQGFALMRAAAKEYSWKLNFGEIAMIWRGGCVIRAHFLHRIKEAFDKDAKLANLMLAPYFKEIVEKGQDNWRKVVVTAVQLGIPVMAFSSALNYFDSYRNPRLSANMIQAQRDYFGAHTYERVDKKGKFHTEWLG